MKAFKDNLERWLNKNNWGAKIKLILNLYNTKYKSGGSNCFCWSVNKNCIRKVWIRNLLLKSNILSANLVIMDKNCLKHKNLTRQQRVSKIRKRREKTQTHKIPNQVKEQVAKTACYQLRTNQPLTKSISKPNFSKTKHTNGSTVSCRI